MDCSEDQAYWRNVRKHNQRAKHGKDSDADEDERRGCWRVPGFGCEKKEHVVYALAGTCFVCGCCATLIVTAVLIYLRQMKKLELQQKKVDAVKGDDGLETMAINGRVTNQDGLNEALTTAQVADALAATASKSTPGGNSAADMKFQ